ncbi:MAG: hypothetical protein RLZZ227_488 [Pseudomonadota bacterium]|jgi:hypothetical protein
MNAPLILLHDEALRISHPVFKAAPAGTKAIYVWDDAYLRAAGYSLKRLVFIYETLCELPLDIVQGDAASIVTELAPSTLYVPATNNPLILQRLAVLKSLVPVQTVADEAFAVMTGSAGFRRFFHYWNKAQPSAFLHDGGLDA